MSAPRPKTLAISRYAVQMPSGFDEGRLRRIWINLRDGEIVSQRAIGRVLVNY